MPSYMLKQRHRDCGNPLFLTSTQYVICKKCNVPVPDIKQIEFAAAKLKLYSNNGYENHNPFPLALISHDSYFYLNSRNVIKVAKISQKQRMN